MNNDPTIQQLLNDPTRLNAALDFLKSIQAAEIQIVNPTNTIGTATLSRANGQTVIPIPVRISAPIADSDGTVASVSTQLNTLLAALRTVKILPS